MSKMQWNRFGGEETLRVSKLHVNKFKSLSNLSIDVDILICILYIYTHTHVLNNVERVIGMLHLYIYMQLHSFFFNFFFLFLNI